MPKKTCTQKLAVVMHVWFVWSLLKVGEIGHNLLYIATRQQQRSVEFGINDFPSLPAKTSEVQMVEI